MHRGREAFARYAADLDEAEVLPQEPDVLGLAALLSFLEARRDARRQGTA